MGNAWTVNALKLRQMLRRQTASSERAERRLLRYLDKSEAMERAAADANDRQAYGAPLPHVAAAASVLRAHRQATEASFPQRTTAEQSWPSSARHSGAPTYKRRAAPLLLASRISSGRPHGFGC